MNSVHSSNAENPGTSTEDYLDESLRGSFDDFLFSGWYDALEGLWLIIPLLCSCLGSV